MIDTLKLAKLTTKIQRFVFQLEKLRDFKVHQHIDQFYYMQKRMELMVLMEQLEESQRRLSHLSACIDKEYGCVFTNWKRDARWLQYYQMTSNNSC